jgi:signal transduction histidine kinase
MLFHRSPFRWLTWRSGLLCAPLLLVIWMGVSSYQNLRAFQHRVVAADRIFQFMSVSTELFTELEDAESGQRGYLLTGETSYLAPYLVAVEKINRNFETLGPIANALPNGTERLAQLKLLTDSKMAELQRTIDLYRSQGIVPALGVVRTDAGLVTMTQLRRQFLGLINDAYAARLERRNASLAATTRTNLIVTLGGTALFVLLAWATFMIERDQQKRRADAAEIRELNRTLEHKVGDRTRALQEANHELEAFCYSVSHDLRAPLRSVDGFAKMLTRDYSERALDPRALDLMRRMSASTHRMGQLIDDLLNLSRISRKSISQTQVDLSAIAAAVVQDLASQEAGRLAEISIEPGLTVFGDAHLLRIALENLFGNAWKFTRNEVIVRLVFGRSQSREEDIFFLGDNGVGFDMAYSHQLFAPFQRLHHDSEFEGHGIGLATVQRVIHSHGGRIWAEANPGLGATFYFTIPTAWSAALEEKRIDSHVGGQPGRRAAHA